MQTTEEDTTSGCSGFTETGDGGKPLFLDVCLRFNKSDDVLTVTEKKSRSKVEKKYLH